MGKTEIETTRRQEVPAPGGLNFRLPDGRRSVDIRIGELPDLIQTYGVLPGLLPTYGVLHRMYVAMCIAAAAERERIKHEGGELDFDVEADLIADPDAEQEADHGPQAG
jgi:hypothetical protein